MIANFWRDLTIGQVLAVLVGLINLLILFYSGRAARAAKITVNVVRKLREVIGSRDDSIVPTTLVEEISSLGYDLGMFQDQYKRDQDNILTKLRTLENTQKAEHERPANHHY